MGEEGFSYFLLLMFVLWILESIAKARQRRARGGEEAAEEQPAPPALPRAETTTPQERATRRPRTLWEEIAEIARQQLPPDARFPLPPGSQAPDRIPPRRIDAGGGPKQLESPADVPARAPSGRWAEGLEREAAAGSGLPREGRPPGERRSARWLEGASPEDAPAFEAYSLEGTAQLPPSPARPVPAGRKPRALPAQRRRSQPQRAPRETSPRKAPEQRGVAAAPAPQAPPVSRRPDEAAARARPARPRSAMELDIHALRNAPRSELRRLLVLQEVLGPPLALRDDPLHRE